MALEAFAFNDVAFPPLVEGMQRYKRLKIGLIWASDPSGFWMRLVSKLENGGTQRYLLASGGFGL